MGKLMNPDEAMNAIRGNHPIVIESRKYGILANWYAARNKNEFSEWLRRQALAGAYLRIEYGQTWRAWKVEPTNKQRETKKW